MHRSVRAAKLPGADVTNADGLTDLHYAVAANMPGLVKFLLDGRSGSWH